MSDFLGTRNGMHLACFLHWTLYWVAGQRNTKTCCFFLIQKENALFTQYLNTAWRYSDVTVLPLNAVNMCSKRGRGNVRNWSYEQKRATPPPPSPEMVMWQM